MKAPSLDLLTRIIADSSSPYNAAREIAALYAPAPRRKNARVSVLNPLSADTIAQALTTFKTVVPKHRKNAQYTKVLLTITRDNITWTYTDFDTFYTLTFANPGHNDFIGGIPYVDFTRLIKPLKSARLSFESVTDDNGDYVSTIVYANGDKLATYEYVSLDTFVPVPDLALQHTESLDTNVFSLLPFVSTDDSHYILQHISFSTTHVSAADGFRAARFGRESTTPDYIVPASIIADARKLITPYVSVYKNDVGNFYAAVTGTTPFGAHASFIRACETFGKYPDFDRIYPPTRPCIATVKRTDLIAALTYVRTLALDNDKIVRLTFTRDALTVSASANGATLERELVIDTTGDFVHAAGGANIDYLLDIARAFDTDTIDIGFIASEMITTPFTFTSDNSPLDVILMPMHLGR